MRIHTNDVDQETLVEPFESIVAECRLMTSIVEFGVRVRGGLLMNEPYPLRSKLCASLLALQRDQRQSVLLAWREGEKIRSKYKGPVDWNNYSSFRSVRLGDSVLLEIVVW